MTIAITLPAVDDIETYTGLLDFVTDHAELDTATVAQLPALLHTAEYRINRLVQAPEREVIATLNTTADIDFVALPTGFRQMVAVRYVADDGYPLAQVTPNVLRGQYAGDSGRPQVFAISNQSVYFGPMPDAAYAVEIIYLEKIPQLSESNDTNWLLSDHADIYVYGLMSQVAAYRDDMQSAQVWDAAFVNAIGELNEAGNRYRNSTPMRLRSSVVV